MNQHHDHHEPDVPGQPATPSSGAAEDAATGGSGAFAPEEEAAGDQAPGEHAAGDHTPGEHAGSDQAPGEHAGSDQAPGEHAEGEGAVDIEALADSDPRTKGELLAELIAAEAKRDEYLDDLRRSHADFENYRRRVMRDGALQRSGGKSDVAGALLEVLDDLDRTVHAAEGSPDEDLAKGIRLVATKLLEALRQQGLERVDAVDVAFDPNVHEAVQQQPGEGIDGEPKVVTVLRPGYRMDDRVLRAAMVAVES